MTVIGPYIFDCVRYDHDADVLYLAGDPARAVDSDGTSGGHAVSFDENGDLVGPRWSTSAELLDEAAASCCWSPGEGRPGGPECSRSRSRSSLRPSRSYGPRRNQHSSSARPYRPSELLLQRAVLRLDLLALPRQEPLAVRRGAEQGVKLLWLDSIRIGTAAT